MTPRFFCSDGLLEGIPALSREDLHHMQRVLRLRPGEAVIVCDGKGTDAHCVLDENGNPVVRELRPAGGETAVFVHLYPSISKGERMDWLLQKAVELGAASVTPVLSKRCIAGAPDRAKRERWQRILRHAAEQCGRGVLPLLHETLSFAHALEKAPGHCIFCYEETKGYLLTHEFSKMGKPSDISVMTGPEGGYTSEEAAMAEKAGLRPVSLGERILRSETAPLFVQTAILLREMT